GDFGSRAAGVVAAGCDVALHCSGKMDEMIAVASEVPAMSPEGEDRLARAMAATTVDGEGPDLAHEIANRDALLALA
ncbi:MAG TPA: beta-hexosaminidase, partial [Sphingomicrobium sp.]|nr:beta-hexosaminidase [Sphingomicrobium sp.]